MTTTSLIVVERREFGASCLSLLHTFVCTRATEMLRFEGCCWCFCIRAEFFMHLERCCFVVPKKCLWSGEPKSSDKGCASVNTVLVVPVDQICFRPRCISNERAPQPLENWKLSDVAQRLSSLNVYLKKYIVYILHPEHVHAHLFLFYPNMVAPCTSSFKGTPLTLQRRHLLVDQLKKHIGRNST